MKIKDNAHVVIGGMIADKSVKFTRHNQAMAFLTLEDLTGSVEVIVFPKDYSKFQQYLTEDAKVFIVGHATVEEEQNGKLICERVVPFEDVQKELWLQFANKDTYAQQETELFGILKNSDGIDEVVIYVKEDKAVKRLGKNRSVNANYALLEALYSYMGEKNVKVVEKNIEKIR